MPFRAQQAITALTKEKFCDGSLDVVGRKVSKPQILMDIYETARLIDRTAPAA